MDVHQHQDEVDKLSEKADHYKRNIIEEYSKYYQRSGMNIVAHNRHMTTIRKILGHLLPN